VLHHLPDDASAGFPTHRRVMGEFARVLRPGGVLVIGRTTRDQLRDGYWFSALIPQAIAACASVTVPVEILNSILTDCGFRVCDPAVPFDETLQGDAYFDRLGPLDPAWRDGDSVWTLAPAAELEAAIARVRDMEAAGTLAAFVAEHDARRRAAGQATYICAIRR